MNVTRASSSGAPYSKIYTFMSTFWGLFILITFAGTLFGLYSGIFWIIINVIYFIIMMIEGGK